MQIQSNQQTFGTKVLVRPALKEVIETSKAKNIIYKQVEELKQNGVNNFLLLNYNNKDLRRTYINAEVVEIIEDKCYINSVPSKDYLEKEQTNEQPKVLDINTLYEQAKATIVQSDITPKNLLNTLIHEYQEM